MKRYKSYTAKKFKLPKRILFFVIVAVIIFAVTVIVGNNLKSKIDRIDKTTTFETESSPNKETEPEKGPAYTAQHDPALAGVSAGYADLAGLDEGGVRRAVRSVYEAGCNAFCFVAYGDGDKLLYASPAVEEQSGLTASSQLISYRNLKLAVSQADSLGLSTTAVVKKTDTPFNKAVVTELCEIGFDEIIVRGFEQSTALNGSIVDEINRYIYSLRGENDKVRFSPCLNKEIYLSAQNGFYLEPLYEQCEFLSIDMTAVNNDEAKSLSEKLKGSFSAFQMRALLAGENKESADAIRKTLSDSGIKALTYISAPPRAEDTTAKGDS